MSTDVIRIHLLNLITMRKLFLLLGFMLFSMPMFSQLTITDLSYNVDGLQLVKKFYEENIDNIDSYKDKEITLIDFIMYADAYGEGEPFCNIDNVYTLYKQYTFINNQQKDELTFFMRDIKTPKRFVPMSIEKVKSLQMLGDFKYIFMPCKFKIMINSVGQSKEVVFERIVKVENLIIDFSSK